MKKKRTTKRADKKKKTKPPKVKNQTRIEKLEAVVAELAIRVAALERDLKTLEAKQPAQSAKPNPQQWPWPYHPTWQEWKNWPIYYNYCAK